MSAPAGVARQVLILLRVARIRAAGRRERLRQTFRARANTAASGDWSGLSGALTFLLGLVAQGMVAMLLVRLGPDMARAARQLGADPEQARRIGSVVSSCILLWWLAVLLCQGEGAEFDTRQQRRPIWEFLFAMPVRPAAVFVAEWLAPIAANPVLLSAPLVPAIVFGVRFGLGAGVLAALLVGLPIVLTAAALWKSAEIAIVLRAAPRLRGALLGLAGWFAFFGLFAPLLFGAQLPTLAMPIARVLRNVAWPAVTPFRLWIGVWPGHAPSAWRGFAATWLAMAVGLAIAAALARYGFGRGLVGASESARLEGARARSFARAPLARKERLWLMRDRGALVQAVLLPLSLAGMNLFNMRIAFRLAHDAWQSYAAATILLGAYFVISVGPRALEAEGQALWIARTWPIGLEALMRAKAMFWWRLATVLVLPVLALGIWNAPGQFPWFVLVLLVWLPYGLTVSLRAVTQVGAGKTARNVAFVGSLAILAGFLQRRPSLLVLGLLFSVLMTEAMWRGFRARLPYLDDPWSQRLPPPPTLMHALVAIALLVDGVGVVGGVAAGITRHPDPGVLWTAYTATALAVAAGFGWFLFKRGVSLASLWRWKDNVPRRIWAGFAAGLGSGVALGGLALLWQQLVAAPVTQGLPVFGATRAAIAAGAIATVVAAPLAEETLFRGLLFRALASEWGVARAMLASAGLFAAYHPLLAWVPVGALGLLSAWLFRWSGWLGGSVLLHATYNGVLLAAALLSR